MRMMIVNLTVILIGGATGWFVLRHHDGKALGWISACVGVLAGIANSCSAQVLKRIDDIGTLQWPDPSVREKLRNRASIQRGVFRVRWISIWIASVVCVVVGFLIAFYGGNAAPDWMIVIASGGLFAAVYLVLRFIQAFFRLSDEWARLVKEKDEWEQRQNFLRGIHA